MAENTSETGTHKAGLFDIRFIIGALMGIYGVILLITGLLHQRQPARPGPTASTSTSSAASRMIVTAVLFGLWARLRPIVVPDHVETRGRPRLDRPRLGSTRARPSDTPG